MVSNSFSSLQSATQDSATLPWQTFHPSPYGALSQITSLNFTIAFSMVSNSFLLFATFGQQCRILSRLVLVPFLSLLYYDCLVSLSYLFDIVINSPSCRLCYEPREERPRICYERRDTGICSQKQCRYQPCRRERILAQELERGLRIVWNEVSLDVKNNTTKKRKAAKLDEDFETLGRICVRALGRAIGPHYAIHAYTCKSKHTWNLWFFDLYCTFISTYVDLETLVLSYTQLILHIIYYRYVDII